MSQYEQLIHDFNDYLKIVSNAENLEIEIKDKVKFYLDEILKSTKGNRDFYTSVFLRDGETVFLNVMDGINYLVKLNSDFSTDEESSVQFESPESVRMNMSLSPAPISEAENYFLEVLRNERL